MRNEANNENNNNTVPYSLVPEQSHNSVHCQSLMALNFPPFSAQAADLVGDGYGADLLEQVKGPDEVFLGQGIASVRRNSDDEV